MQIVFRADASSRIGTGHVMRCLALAEALMARDCIIHFICDDVPLFLLQLLEQKGITVHSIGVGGDSVADADASKGIVSSLVSVDWLIVDHYDLDQNWEAQLLPLVGRVMVIDDLANRVHQCHLLLDQNFYLNADQRYGNWVPKGTKLLLGPKYALLGKAFSLARGEGESNAARSDSVKRVQVCFGGADPTNECMKTLEALTPLMEGSGIAVEVIIGAACKHHDEIKSFVSRHNWADLVVNASDIAQRMVMADLAIGAAGSMSWERACLGLPSIAIAVAENQILLGQHAATKGVHLFLGWHAGVAVQNLRNAIALLVENESLRQSFARASREVCDGNGVGRVVKALLGQGVSVRAAVERDALTVFTWRNAIENRRHSHDDQAISWETHKPWFEAAVKNPDRIILIGEDAYGELGVVRYDRKDGYWLVSIYLAPERHGSGLGEPLLRAGSAWLRAQHPEIHEVRAEILVNNGASHDVFLRAGYKPAFVTYLEAL